MESKSFKIGWILLLVVYGLGSVTALLVVFVPMSLIGGEIEAYTGQPLSEFISSYEIAYSYLLLEILEQGIFMFGSYFLPILILLNSFRKKEKWAWYALLISVIINTLATIGGNYPTGDMNVVYMSALSSIVGFIGLGITAKSFFQTVEE